MDSVSISPYIPTPSGRVSRRSAGIRAREDLSFCLLFSRDLSLPPIVPSRRHRDGSLLPSKFGNRLVCPAKRTERSFHSIVIGVTLGRSTVELHGANPKPLGM